MPAEPGPRVRRPKTARRHSGRSIILVVEDEAGIRQPIISALQAEYAVHGAGSAAEARAVLSGLAPDLLVLDIHLVDGSGLDLLAELRQRSTAAVLLMTGHRSETVAARAVELRANAYLAKPFSLEALRAKVAALLAEGPRVEHLAERARGLLEAALAESLTAGDIAARLGVKPRRLLAVFRARFAQTPVQYLRRVRLQRARALLVATELPVADIAARVGFQYASYFNRSFRREFGVTPVEFRRHHIPHPSSPKAS